MQRIFPLYNMMMHTLHRSLSAKLGPVTNLRRAAAVAHSLASPVDATGRGSSYRSGGRRAHCHFRYNLRVAAEPTRRLLSDELESVKGSLTTTERGHRVSCPLPPESSLLASSTHYRSRTELPCSNRVWATCPSVQEARSPLGLFPRLVLHPVFTL